MQHKEQNRIWGADEKYEFVAQVLAGKTYREVAISAGIERMRAEIAVIKKEIALREERYAAQLKAKKQRSSKNSGKKDIH